MLIKSGAFLKTTIINSFGKNNLLTIEKGCRISNCQFRFFGNGNRIHIAHDSALNGVDVWISDGGYCYIGNHTHITGNTHIACIEGKSAIIGERCLFSNNITIRTGDSHSILDLEGNRVNYSRDIHIDDHVWLGQNVVILKGSHISKDSIVGTGSIITGKSFKEGVVIAGNPAKEIRNCVSWHHDTVE